MMKRLTLVFIFAVSAGVFGIYGQTKNDDILKLLRVTGTDKLADQMMAAMIPQFQQLVPGVPNIYWAKFRDKMNIDDLLYACVLVYNKYYTHDEIKQLLVFYGTPLGKKVIEVTPLLTQETMAVGQAWGEKLGRDIVNELIKEGYLEG